MTHLNELSIFVVYRESFYKDLRSTDHLFYLHHHACLMAIDNEFEYLKRLEEGFLILLPIIDFIITSLKKDNLYSLQPHQYPAYFQALIHSSLHL